MEVHYVNSVVEVLPEVSSKDFFRQVTVSSKDEPDVYLFIFLSTDAAELAILQKLQELGLRARIKFSDFIEKKRTRVSQLYPSGFAPTAPVKAPFSYPKSSLSRSAVGIAAQLS